jgi:hypothetical protein
MTSVSQSNDKGQPIWKVRSVLSLPMANGRPKLAAANNADVPAKERKPFPPSFNGEPINQM